MRRRKQSNCADQNFLILAARGLASGVHMYWRLASMRLVTRESIKLTDPDLKAVMKRLIGVYVLLVFGAVSLAQTIVGPHGEGSVVFRSPGGRWEKAVITDQLTGESSTAYSLEAESGGIDARTGRHPRIVFSCQQSGKFDGIRIRTGTIVANQSPGIGNNPPGQTQVSSRSDHEKMKMWTAGITGDGSVLVADERIIPDLVGHKRFVIRFISASGATIVDQYLTEGLSIRSLKTDCSTFSKR
jgi:hypothetical protein